jgi:Trypsin-co-occurring domain 2
MAAAKTLPLADLIQEVSTQLREARERYRATGQNALLEFASCTLELGVTWGKKADGGIDIKVVKLGGGLNKTNTQTITVVLQAPTIQWPSSEPSRPYIALQDQLTVGIAEPGLAWPPLWQHVHDEGGLVQTLAVAEEDDKDNGPGSQE